MPVVGEKQQVLGRVVKGGKTDAFEEESKLVDRTVAEEAADDAGDVGGGDVVGEWNLGDEGGEGDGRVEGDELGVREGESACRVEVIGESKAGLRQRAAAVSVTEIFKLGSYCGDDGGGGGGGEKTHGAWQRARWPENWYPGFRVLDRIERG